MAKLDNIIVINKLYIMFQTLWDDKFTKGHTGEIIEIWHDIWFRGLIGIELTHIEQAFRYCQSNLVWPPCLAEFIKICEKYENIPDYEECMKAAIREDFYHPLIRAIYLKVGSWDMKNDTEKGLRGKFKRYHKEELAWHRLANQREALNQMENNHEQSQGCDTIRDQSWGNGVRKAAQYLL